MEILKYRTGLLDIAYRFLNNCVNCLSYKIPTTNRNYTCKANISSFFRHVRGKNME